MMLVAVKQLLFSSCLVMKNKLSIGLKLFRTDESSPGFFKMLGTAAIF